jgi:carbon-monoxide dehydrogenase large subunit
MTETVEAAATEEQRYVGAGVLRKEDPELITGQARFIDDITVPGMVWVALVRSPYAHARITRVDVSRALEAPGVVAAFSGADLADDWAGPLPMAWPVTEDINNPSHWPLAKDKARFAGDGVAVVVAASRALAKDAAQLVDVEYEPLAVVTDIEAALADGAPLVHDEFGTNRCYTWTLEGPEEGAVDRVFAESPVTIKERYRQQRLIPNAIEPRIVLVQPFPATDELTIWSATQIPHILRTTLSGVLGLPSRSCA